MSTLNTLLTLIKNPLVKGVSVTLLLKASGLAAGLFMHLLLVKQMSLAEYGEFSFILSLAMVGSVIGRLALDVSLIRILTNAIENNRYGLFKGSIIWSLFITTILSSIFAAAVFFFGSSVTTNSLEFAVPISIGISLTLIAQAILRVSGKNIIAFSPDMLGRPLLTSVIVLAVGQYYGEVSLTQALVAHSIVAGMMVMWAWASVFNTIPKKIRASVAHVTHTEWFSIALPVFFSTFVLMAEIHLTILLVGWLMSSQDTGVVSLCIRLAALASLSSVAVSMYIAPKLALLYQQQEIARLKNLVRNSSRIMLAPTVVVLLFFFIFGSSILEIFGEGFGQYNHLLLLFTFSRVLVAVFGPVHMLMQMSNREKENASITSVCLIFYILISAAIIPFYGLTGLGVVTCLFVFIRELTNWYVVKKHIHISSGSFVKATKS